MKINKQNISDSYLRELAIVVNKQKPKNKHWYIRPLRNAKFGIRNLRALGFKISFNLWRSCLTNTMERNLGGRKSLPEEEIDNINNFLYQESREAANRVIQKKIITINKFGLKEKSNKALNVRYLNESLIDTYYSYKNIKKSAVSFSSLYKYKAQCFKKAKLDTDRCEYCINNKLIQKQIKQMAIDLNCNTEFLEDSEHLLKHAEEKYETAGTELESEIAVQTETSDLENDLKLLLIDFSEFTSSTLISFLKSELEKPVISQHCSLIISKLKTQQLILFLRLFCLIKLIKHKLQLDFHRNIAIRQRKAYNFFRQDREYLNNNVVLDFDFKQKLNIGLGPLNNSFYKQRTISYLTFGLYYVESDTIKCMNYDLLSDNLHQDANSVIRGLRFIRSLESFKQIEANKKNYTVFCDCGSHFRNQEILHYFMDELAKESILVSLNYFAPKHGKSIRDQHLSIIGFILRHNKKSMVRIEEVCEFINARYERSNLVRDSTKFKTFAFKLNPLPNETVFIEERVVNNFKDYFNFRSLNINVNGGKVTRLFSSLFSDIVVDPIKLTGVVPIHSVYKSYSKVLNFNEPKIKNVEFPIEDELKLEKWKGREKRMMEILKICVSTLNEDNEQSVDVTHVGGFDNYKQQPLYCYENCKKCTASVKYTIEDIKNKNYTNQKMILEELFLHGHKKSLQLKKLKRNRSLLEARMELIKHIEFFHQGYSKSNNDKFNSIVEINLSEGKELKNIKKKRDKLPGLNNLVYTCFINSTLQCLNSIPKFVEYFKKDFKNVKKTNEILDHFEIADCFSELIKKSQEQKEKFVDTKLFVMSFLKVYNHFRFPVLKSRVCNQQDSHEFLKLLMESLTIGLSHDSEWPYILNLFKGVFQYTINGTCGHSSESEEIFNELQIEIPPKFNIIEINLNDCLKSFFKAELLDKNNMWQCEVCNCKVDAIRKIRIKELPPVLIIQLKRFIIHENTSYKKQDYVDFPLENLKLDEFLSVDIAEKSLPKYKLFGIINHFGKNLDEGHYISFCKSAFNNKWFKYDDQNVLEIKNLDKLDSNHAYMLFYSKENL